MRSIFRVGGRCRRIDFPPPEISSLRYEISTSPRGGGEIQAADGLAFTRANQAATFLFSGARGWPTALPKSRKQ